MEPSAVVGTFEPGADSRGMRTADTRSTLETRLRRALAAEPGIEAAWLFGSRAGGEGPYAIEGLRTAGYPADVPWTVRVHDRHTVSYRSYTGLVERT